MDLNNIPEDSGLYCLKIRGGLTKFGVARNLQSRLGSREYKTSIIDDHRIWLVPEDKIFEKETNIRYKFKDSLRPGFKDYLLGDHFNSVVEFVDELVKKPTGCLISLKEKLYGLPAIKKILGLK